MKFYVGQKVVCINDRFPIQVLEWGSQLPVHGETYTVDSVGIAPGNGFVGPAIQVVELRNPGNRLWFNERRFVLLDRPLRETHAISTRSDAPDEGYHWGDRHTFSDDRVIKCELVADRFGNGGDVVRTVVQRTAARFDA